MQQRVVPVAVPVLEEDPIELVIHACVRRAEVHRHVRRRVRVDEEPMDGARLDRDLAVVPRDRFPRPVDFDAHHAGLDPEVLRLEPVEMQKRALGSVGPVEQFAEVGRDFAHEVVFVGLAEQEASSRRGLEELGCQQAAEAVGGKRGSVSRACVALSSLWRQQVWTCLMMVDCPAEVW